MLRVSVHIHCNFGIILTVVEWDLIIFVANLRQKWTSKQTSVPDFIASIPILVHHDHKHIDQTLNFSFESCSRPDCFSTYLAGHALNAFAVQCSLFITPLITRQILI